MTTRGFLRLRFYWMLFLAMALPTVVTGQTAPAAERQKIESLIKQVGELKDAKFIRNGATHDVSTAVRFLRGKWEANDADVKTAKDFIDKVASASGTSGKPYLIRFKDGRETKSRDFLLVELRKLES
jgi:cation diffusion facilitator CzcD-associated flavoprotein CzcO